MDAIVGYVNRSDAGDPIEHLNGEMTSAAGADATHVQFARLRLAKRDQLGNALCRHIFIQQ